MDDKANLFCRMRAGNGPAWRWDRAGQLLADQVEPDALDDSLTVAAWRLREMVTAGHGLTVTAASPLLDPALTAAYKAYAGGGYLKSEIEARVLAAEALETISQKCKVPVAVIVMYCDAFFDVRDRLHASSWLMEHVLDMHLGSGQPLSEPQIWKYAALAGGSVLVDLLVADFHGLAEPQIPHRHLQAQKVRVMAWEAVTGYSTQATEAVIRVGRAMFAGPRRGKRSAAKRGIARDLTSLQMLTDLQAKGARGS